MHYKPPAELSNPDYEDHGGSLHGGYMAHHVTCVYELCTVEPGTGGFVSVSIADTCAHNVFQFALSCAFGLPLAGLLPRHT